MSVLNLTFEKEFWLGGSKSDLKNSTCSCKCGSNTDGSSRGCIKYRFAFPTRHVMRIVTVVNVRGVQEVHVYVQRIARDDGHPTIPVQKAGLIWMLLFLMLEPVELTGREEGAVRERSRSDGGVGSSVTTNETHFLFPFRYFFFSHLSFSLRLLSQVYSKSTCKLSVFRRDFLTVSSPSFPSCPPLWLFLTYHRITVWPPLSHDHESFALVHREECAILFKGTKCIKEVIQCSLSHKLWRSIVGKWSIGQAIESVESWREEDTDKECQLLFVC